MPKEDKEQEISRWEEIAREARLRYITDFEGGYTRRKCGKGFRFLNSKGQTITSKKTKQRLKSLVIPPAWSDVWICPYANGHIQAVGYDDAGRKQYLYHSRWQIVSSRRKYDKLQTIAKLLPRIRRHVREDLNGDELTKDRVTAAIVRLMDKAYIRVGDEKYTEKHESHGVTTLTNEHVTFEDMGVTFNFTGKSGQERTFTIRDKTVASVIEHCVEVDGEFLFSYRQEEDSESSPVRSSDVNQYLSSASHEEVTAKDFRTWRGSVIALSELAKMPDDLSERQRKKYIVGAVEKTAEALGNTKAVCRSSYIHPGLISAAETGMLPALLRKANRRMRQRAELTKDEILLDTILPLLPPITTSQQT